MKRTTQMTLMQLRNHIATPAGLLVIGLAFAIAAGAVYSIRLIPVHI
jgi:hypothetical protein